MNESDFMVHVEKIFSALSEEIITTYGQVVDVDCDESVLTLELPEQRSYVINRHTPSRQIWVSSPVSGPSYYTYNTSKGTWCDTKNPTLTLRGHLLGELQHIQF